MRELGDLVKNKNLSGLILGPEIETIYVNAKVPPGRPIDGRTYYFDDSLSVQVQKVVKMPFYGLYPLLVFEGSIRRLADDLGRIRRKRVA